MNLCPCGCGAGLLQYWQRQSYLAKFQEEDEYVMPIMVNQGDNKSFEPAPEGLHSAVCVDVVDRGILPTTYGPKHKIDVIWQVVPVNEDGTEVRDSEGRRFQTMQRYTASVHSKALLHQHLKAWRGRAFTDEELKAFDVEKLIGACCQLQLIHNVIEGGRVYANVQAIVPFPKKDTKLRPADYVRMKDRAQQGGGHDGAPPVENDEDLPF